MVFFFLQIDEHNDDEDDGAGGLYTTADVADGIHGLCALLSDASFR